MDISYFELSYDDIEQVSALERKFFSQPWSEAGIGHYMDAGNTVFIVAKHGETVAGYAALMCILDEGNLVSIGVDEGFRRMGVASELMDILYEQGWKRGVRSIHLEVRKSNQKAISLYEKQGFKQSGIRKGFYSRPAEDALLYTRLLEEEEDA